MATLIQHPKPVYSNQNIENMVGKTIVKIIGEIDSDEMVFHTDNGSIYTFYHDQDCCENVDIVDIIGDLSDLIGSPLLIAEERAYDAGVVPNGIKEDFSESFQWTFYEFATIKGSVTVRWVGESNGYYSMSVYFKAIENKIPDIITAPLGSYEWFTDNGCNIDSMVMKVHDDTVAAALVLAGWKPILQ